MADQTALANRTAPETGMERVKSYLLSPEVKERFSDMMGANGIYYLNQVMILVANSENLQKCTPKSILISAMRAASLRLSVDPGQGQAWIIPYNGVASFQLGYKGVYELALRTNLYRFINVIDIYEGESLVENRMTGIHAIEGKRTGNRVIARMLYFCLLNGFEKTFAMTVEEIEAHAKHYSQAYKSSNSKWNDPYERPKMERKTVLVNGLRRWGRFNQGDVDLINEIESEQGYIDRGELPDEDQVSLPITVKKTEAQLNAELGIEPDKKPDPQPEPVADKVAPQFPVDSDKPWASTKISLEMAKTEKASNDHLYWEMETEELSFRFNTIEDALKKNGLTQDKKDAMTLKRDVVKAIMDWRASEVY